jgi:hypothetical protein
MDYKLELPPYLHVHIVFHVSFLKKIIDDKILVQTILPKIIKEGVFTLKIETILE